MVRDTSKKEEDQIIDSGYAGITCLLCGKTMGVKWEDYSPYHECDCEKAKHNRNIREKINKLEDKLFDNEFKIEHKPHLIKVK